MLDRSTRTRAGPSGRRPGVVAAVQGEPGHPGGGARPRLLTSPLRASCGRRPAPAPAAGRHRRRGAAAPRSARLAGLVQHRPDHHGRRGAGGLRSGRHPGAPDGGGAPGRSAHARRHRCRAGAPRGGQGVARGVRVAQPAPHGRRRGDTAGGGARRAGSRGPGRGRRRRGRGLRDGRLAARRRAGRVVRERPRSPRRGSPRPSRRSARSSPRCAATSPGSPCPRPTRSASGSGSRTPPRRSSGAAPATAPPRRSSSPPCLAAGFDDRRQRAVLPGHPLMTRGGGVRGAHVDPPHRNGVIRPATRRPWVDRRDADGIPSGHWFVTKL